MTGRVSQFEQTGNPRTAPVREGEVIAGKYVIGEELGVGGMGVVVAARDQLLDRKVAIKFLLPMLATSENAVSRFKREARLATRITSPHVVTLLEIDELPNGTPFFVMEYLEGRDFRKVLADDGPLPAADAVDYLLQATEAVAEGHLRGIVHRDLKPSNLFLTQRADGSPLVKVLDFGIAKALEFDAAVDATLTRSNDLRLGSPAYMSPEQLQRPHDVDARADLWALGVTLYELVCGRLPFDGRTPIELVVGITKEAPRPLHEHYPSANLPHGLESCILRCLEKDREHRFQNAGELAEALVPFGGDEARVSLRRIRGPRSTPPPPGVIGSEPTLAIAPPSVPPSEPPPANDDTQTGAAARRRSLGVAVALICVVSAAAAFIGRVGGGDPSRTTAQPVRDRKSADTVASAPEVPTFASAAALVPAAPGVTLEREGSVAPPTKAISTVSPARRGSAIGPRGREPGAAPAAASVSLVIEAPSAVADPVAPPTASGRSPRIERLIERRH